MAKETSLLKNKKLNIIFGVTFIAVMGTPNFTKVAQLLHLSKGEVALLISSFTFPGILVVLFLMIDERKIRVKQ